MKLYAIKKNDRYYILSNYAIWLDLAEAGSLVEYDNNGNLWLNRINADCLFQNTKFAYRKSNELRGRVVEFNLEEIVHD